MSGQVPLFPRPPRRYAPARSARQEAAEARRELLAQLPAPLPSDAPVEALARGDAWCEAEGRWTRVLRFGEAAFDLATVARFTWGPAPWPWWWAVHDPWAEAVEGRRAGGFASGIVREGEAAILTAMRRADERLVRAGLSAPPEGYPEVLLRG
jgi:hypothetical protein